MANSIDVGIVKGIDGKSPYQVAVEEGYTGTEAEFYAALVSLQNAPFLPSNGGQMSGPLDMGGYRIDNIQRLGVPIGGNPLTVTASGLSITDGSNEKFGVSSGRVDVHNSVIQNVSTPSQNADAANKQYVDNNALLKKGGSMSGDIDMNSHSVKGLSSVSLKGNQSDTATLSYQSNRISVSNTGQSDPPLLGPIQSPQQDEDAANRGYVKEYADGKIKYGTSDPGEGSSLESGSIYIVYE